MPPRPRSRPDPARDTAYDLLRAVDERGAFANLALPALLRERRLEPRDAALATELGYGTLRAQGTLDAVLASCVDRPLADVDRPLLLLLRLGADQLLLTRVPPHAAVSTTVALARGRLGEGPGKFANAVLRRVARKDLAGWLAELAPPYDVDPVAHLVLATFHPPWVVEAFREALGGDLAETATALAADNAPPAVHLVARPGRIPREDLLAAAGPGSQAGSWSTYAVYLGGGDPGRLAAVRDGRAAVQDEGSQLAALALAGAQLDGPDHRWLDVCAGPGGKAGLLAGLVAARGGRLLAADRAPHRARLVRSTLAGVAGTAEPAGAAGTSAPRPTSAPNRAGAFTAVVVADGTVPAWSPGAFDRVLVDAPCSGLGALRRRPEARWRRTAADVAGLVPLQRALLDRALTAARPGGLVAFVTCSPHRPETVEVVDAVVGVRPDVERLDVRPLLAGVPHLGAGPHVQLWPHRHGTDAMFIALLRPLRRP